MYYNISDYGLWRFLCITLLDKNITQMFYENNLQYYIHRCKLTEFCIVRNPLLIIYHFNIFDQWCTGYMYLHFCEFIVDWPLYHYHEGWVHMYPCLSHPLLSCLVLSHPALISHRDVSQKFVKVNVTVLWF